MKIDLSKLKEQPSVEKAVFPWTDGPIFGTIYLSSRAEVVRGESADAMERHHPKDREFFNDGYHDIELPDGWKQKREWRNEDSGCGASFVAHWLEVPMKIRAFEENGGRVPDAVGALLSGYLQTGEAINLRNYDNYNQRKNLKFLPFVITPTGLRYYMYKPGPETMRAAIVRFTAVLEKLGDAADQDFLKSILEATAAIIHLSRAEQLLEESLIEGSITRVREKLQAGIDASLNSCGVSCTSLGFVYKDLQPGPHDATHFSCDMFFKREK